MFIFAWIMKSAAIFNLSWSFLATRGFFIPRHNLHMRCSSGVSRVHENEVDFSFRFAILCPFGSLRLRLMNDYSMSNYKQDALFTRSAAANESGCAFDGLTPPTPEILSDGNHELWTKPVSTMRIYLRVLRHCHLLLLLLFLYISRYHLPPLTLPPQLLRIARSRVPLTWFR